MNDAAALAVCILVSGCRGPICDSCVPSSKLTLEDVKLGKLAQVFEGVRTTIANLDPAVGEPYRIIQCCDLVDGRVAARRKLKEVFLDPSRLPARIAVRSGDILVALAAVDVTIAIVRQELAWCVPDHHVAVIRAPDETSRARIAEYLSTTEGRATLTALKSGKVVRHLLTRDLRNVELPF